MRQESKVAIRAARAAGEILRDGWGKAHRIEYKGPIDIVTETDRASEVEIITLLQNATPEYGYLTEETAPHSMPNSSRWIIDPLDGTVNYAQGVACFCVSIALERAGQLEIGVIYDPLRNELFVAERGSGAQLNGIPFHTGEKLALIEAVVSTGFPYDAWKAERDNSNEVAHFVPRVRGMRSIGASALALAHVACGRLDAHWERGLAPYDVAAGVLLVREAGGRVTDYAGNEDCLYSEEIVAANSRLHQEMVAYLSSEH